MTREQQVFSGQQFQSVNYSSQEHNRLGFPLQQTSEKFYNKLIKCGGKNHYFLDNNLNLTFRKMVVKFKK
jgi:hypothetical protein